MGRYLLRGVDKQSGSDAEILIDADTSANAKVKGELKGLVVTEVMDLARPVAAAVPPLQPQSGEKPWQVSTMGVLRIVSGVCNILAGIVFCWLILPLGLIPLGIIEILSGINLQKDRPAPSQNPTLIPILEIVGILTLAGWIPLVIGILSLVWLADPNVKRYFATLRPAGFAPLSPPPVSRASAAAPAGSDWPLIR